MGCGVRGRMPVWSEREGIVGGIHVCTLCIAVL